MTNKNISGLTAATTPLAGTESIPIWDGATKKIAAEDIAKSTQPSSTANTIPYLNGSKVPTSGTALQFNSKVIGLLLTPSAWATNYTGVQCQEGYGSFTGNNGNGIFDVASNAYDDGTWKYKNSSVGAVRVSGDPVGKTVKIYTAPSGTADTAITWAQRFTVSDTAITFNADNLVQGTAAKGINFTANTPAAGMTSQLLNWYEEGTWSPTLTPAGGSITLNSTLTKGLYTRIGRQVTHTGLIYVTSVSSPTGALTIGGFPFTSAADYGGRSAGSVSATTLVVGSVSPLMLTISGSSVIAQLDKFVAGSRAVMSADVQADSAFNICLTYMI